MAEFESHKRGPRFRPLSRRSFLTGAAAALTLPFARPLWAAAPTILASREMVWGAANPFSLGIASGAPKADGFVLWTRLAPDPLSEDPSGGMTTGDIEIGYEIATDPAFQVIVRDGVAIAESRFAHAVHLAVQGLAPARPYFYRFFSGEWRSAIGRATTAPAPGSDVDSFKFGFCACANYEQGYFAAYRHLAEENPDLVFFLGDYIYEASSPGGVRQHAGAKVATTLTDYRTRYAQYRMDDDLQRLHAAASCLVTWDDHEVENDYAGDLSEKLTAPAQFAKRRAAAYQAFYEHMPLDPALSAPQPDGTLRLYSALDWGGLMRIHLLDGRQYRSPGACYGPGKGGGHIESAASCPELMDPARSMLGFAQEKWLHDSLSASPAKWNLIAQNVLMAQMLGDGRVWTEAWDGYPAARTRLLTHLRDAKVANPIVIGGDNHAFWANDLKLDPRDEKSPTVATEFICSSITSHGPSYEETMKRVAKNPHVKYFESRMRGYAVGEVTRGAMSTRFRSVNDATGQATGGSTIRELTREFDSEAKAAR